MLLQRDSLIPPTEGSRGEGRPHHKGLAVRRGAPRAEGSGAHTVGRADLKSSGPGERMSARTIRGQAACTERGLGVGRNAGRPPAAAVVGPGGGVHRESH